MADPRELVKHDDNALQKLLDVVPGYKGYHEREERRNADKVLREHLVGLMNGVLDRLKAVQGKLADGGELKMATDLDRVNRRLIRAKDRVQHASYGYAGFFDPVTIEKGELDRLYDYDLALRDYVGKVDQATEALKTAAQDQQADLITKLGEAIDELGRMIDGRNEAAADLSP